MPIIFNELLTSRFSDYLIHAVIIMWIVVTSVSISLSAIISIVF
ncbi:hypothetical protein CDS [Salmonella enterica subsp. enterica serovar Derby]|nr:hypothetical protein CDS [Salmonella enterica subsp. enterica serovar Derby]